jgi:hypothetical protein
MVVCVPPLPPPSPLPRALPPPQDREGALGPTKKGLSLSQSDWGALLDTLPSVSQALADSNEDFVAELPNNRRVTVSVFRCVEGS